MPDTIEARVTHRSPHSAERQFDSWLDPAKVRVWMALPFDTGMTLDMRRVEIDPRAGGRFCFSDQREAGEAVHWGEYRVLERPRKLAFTWWTSEEEEALNKSLVTLTFAPDGDGTLVTLTHEMDARWADYVPRVMQSWGGMLAHVAEMLGTA